MDIFVLNPGFEDTDNMAKINVQMLVEEQKELIAEHFLRQAGVDDLHDTVILLPRAECFVKMLKNFVLFSPGNKETIV